MAWFCPRPNTATSLRLFVPDTFMPSMWSWLVKLIRSGVWGTGRGILTERLSGR